jgi:hypothetical protein
MGDEVVQTFLMPKTDDFEKIWDEKNPTRFDHRVRQLGTRAQELETVLAADMPDIASYVVSQKGIYRTDDLISHAERHLTEISQGALPSQACDDLRQAGSCLAYELPTACAFHLWRAVETTMGHYFKRLNGKDFDDAGVTRNWAKKIEALNKQPNVDSKVTTFLDHIRDKYRNPQTHPDQIVSLEDAQRLFNVAISSIEQMLLESLKLPAAPASSTAPSP